MRHLIYHWVLQPKTYGFNPEDWPAAGNPISIFTSSFGSAGKISREPISTTAQPRDNWSGKQVSFLPLVPANQFIVVNSFGSTPGVLPLPKRVNACRTYRYTFELKVPTLPGLGQINELQYIESGNITLARTKDLSNPTGSFNTEGEPYNGVFSTAANLKTILEDFYNQFQGAVTVTKSISGNFDVFSCTVDFTLYGSNQPLPLISIQYQQTSSIAYAFGGNKLTLTPTGSCVETIDFIEGVKPNGFVNLIINDTQYYVDPASRPSFGISGDAAPFPRNVGFKVPQYELRPNVYVLPGQSWDVQYTVMNDIHALNSYLEYLDTAPTPPEDPAEFGTYWKFAEVFLSYWIFEDAEALICQKLLQLGIPVIPDTVDWYKKRILESEGLDWNTYEKYLEVMREWREIDKKREAAYHKKRGERIRTR